MPIQKPHQFSAPVFFPQSDYKISRYLDIFKFISLLQSSALFFSRLDKFEDKFEGTLPALNIEYLKNWYRQPLLNNKPQTDDDIINASVDSYINIQEKFKRLTCISCWNSSPSESYALWKIYSEMNKGIMISSSINKIIDAFSETKEDIQLSEVKYIDHEGDLIKSGNLHYAIIHKNVAYSYENEVRLIHHVHSNIFDYNWDLEKNPNGKYIKINLDCLIDEIILSPYSSQYFHDVILDLLVKYNLDKKVKFSKLKK